MYLIANNYTSISYRQVIHVDSCRGLASLELERSSEEGLSRSGVNKHLKSNRRSELAAYVHLRWLSRLLCSALRYVVEIVEPRLEFVACLWLLSSQTKDSLTAFIFPINP